MDNVCHTLFGAACAEAGLKSRTRFATATLLIASNLPDVDVLVSATSVPSVAFRRGWTHGVLAQALLPMLLTGVMLAIDALRPSRDAAAPRANARGLLLVSYVGVLSHVALDYLNNYGVRLLMPFSNRWFYGDTLFIVDPWLWLALGAGAWLARRRGEVRPARAALLISTIYIVMMLASAHAARASVLESWRAEHAHDPRSLMVGPVFADPLRKDVILDRGDGYQHGTFRWIPRTLRFEDGIILTRAETPAAVAARRDPAVQALLSWARFPYFEIETESWGTRVIASDLRFGRLIAATSVMIKN